MSILSNAAIIWPHQLDTNQADIVAAMVNEILGCLVLRLRRQLIIIQLPVVLPVHPKNVALPHKRERCLTKKAEPPPTRGVNRDSGTDSANGGWLRRLVRCHGRDHLLVGAGDSWCWWRMWCGTFAWERSKPNQSKSLNNNDESKPKH